MSSVSFLEPDEIHYSNRVIETIRGQWVSGLSLQGRFRKAWPHRCVEGFKTRPRKARGFFYSLFVRFVFNYLRRWRGSPIIALKGGLPGQTRHDDHVSTCFLESQFGAGIQGNIRYYLTALSRLGNNKEDQGAG